MLSGMFSVSEAEAAAIRAAYEQGGESAAAVELRRYFAASTALPRHGNTPAPLLGGSRCRCGQAGCHRIARPPHDQAGLLQPIAMITLLITDWVGLHVGRSTGQVAILSASRLLPVGSVASRGAQDFNRPR